MELQGTPGADALNGGADNDTLYGYGGNDTLKGGAGDDVLAGNEGADILQGGDGDDYLLGGPGNDTLDGGAGNDWAAYEDATAGVKVDLSLTVAQNTVGGGTDKLTSIENVYGSAFNDTLTGNVQANMMVGGEGNDALYGGKGDDTLWGSAGVDLLDGGDGDDYLVGGAGNDVIRGGAGWDWSSYEDATAGVTVDLNKTGGQDTGGSGIDTLSEIEHLYGSKFNDTLTGDAKDNYLWGDAGDDKLYGGAGDDHLSGGAGVNWINGGDGFDTVDYAFSDKGVTINLSMGAPPMGGSPLVGDWLTSIEAAMGSAHDDVITGNASENYLYGDAGNDAIIAVGGHDTLEGGEGNDTLYASNGGTGDLLLGGAGDDLAVVYSGSTIVDGGEGSDTLEVLSNAALKIDLRILGDQEIASGLHVELRGVENLTGGAGNDNFTGDANDNVFTGGAGDDVVDGGAGSDTVSFAADGQTGDLWVDLRQSVQQLYNGRGTDTLISIENVIGAAGNDVLIGNAQVNHLFGGAGNDALHAVGGGDFLEGGVGDDILHASQEGAGDHLSGGAGNDSLFSQNFAVTMDGGAGDDVFYVLQTPGMAGVVAVDGGDGIDTLDLRNSYLLINNLKVDLNIVGKQDIGPGQWLDIKGVENVTGGFGNDHLIGDAKDNVLKGGLGDDILDGGAGVDIASYAGNDMPNGVSVDLRNAVQNLGPFGKDTFVSIEGVWGTDYSDTLVGNDQDNVFIGGRGDDVINGGAGIDTVSYLNDGLQTGAYVNLWLEAQVASDRGNDTLISIENVIGSAYDDMIAGSVGANVLTGGEGNDLLDGRGGADLLNGGVGDDFLSTYWEQGGVWANASGSVLRGGEGRDNFDLGLGDMRAEGGAGDDHFSLNNLAGAKVIEGGDGYDTLQFELRIGMGVDYTNGVTVDLTKAGSQQIAAGVTATISSIERIFGSQGNDLITGDNADNYLDGFDGNDTVSGGAGNDTLVGRNGADTLIGGEGRDILYGGADVDTFRFMGGDSLDLNNTGDNADTIMDFQTIDKLAFGAGAMPAYYREHTAASFAEAQDLAKAGVTSGALAKYYTAVQVGSDTFVFVAGTTGNSAGMENVVKLVGVGLGAVDAANFIPV